MLELLLNPTALTVALIVVSFGSPLIAFLLRGRLINGRLRVAIGASGPVLLMLWGLYNLVLETIGFASVWSLLILLIIGVGLGMFSGWWIAGGEIHQEEKG